jgi:hypothetical protein
MLSGLSTYQHKGKLAVRVTQTLALGNKWRNASVWVPQLIHDEAPALSLQSALQRLNYVKSITVNAGHKPNILPEVRSSVIIASRRRFACGAVR